MRLTELGGEQMPMTPTEFGKFFVKDTEKWARVIRAANIKAEWQGDFRFGSKSAQPWETRMSALASFGHDASLAVAFADPSSASVEKRWSSTSQLEKFHHQEFEGRIMKLRRRQFLHLAAGAATLPAVSRIARAQAYPSRPIRLVVGFPPGGVGDILARLIGQSLSSRLGQPLSIENRPGAGGNIGAEVVVRAPADGYALFLANTANAINAALYDKLSFDFIRDTEPVGSIARAPGVLEVNPAVPVRSVPEFIAYAKANPARRRRVIQNDDRR
jgi:hypothetical protein